MDSPEREKLRQTETEKLATIRAKIDNGEPLTEREATLLAKFTRKDEQARIEQVLRNVPIDVWNEAVERNHVAPTPHKANAFFRRIGVPVPTGKKSVAKTFDLYKFLDWFLGEFLAEPNDDTAVSNPNIYERLKQKQVIAQTELTNVKVAKERMKLVPIRDLAFVMHALGARFNRFGEKLKSRGQHELLDEFNEIVSGSVEQFEGLAREIVQTKYSADSSSE